MAVMHEKTELPVHIQKITVKKREREQRYSGPKPSPIIFQTVAVLVSTEAFPVSVVNNRQEP
jgi:hypothetical protein